jgi:drug/metabolite transporter (DMT)-like permease
MVMPLAALLYALLAIVLWSFLAVLVVSLAHLPPLLVTGAALLTGGLLSIFRVRRWRVSLPTLVVGIGGMFGYHFFYFNALQKSPAVEASLVNYLWPLLIVLLSPLFLPGTRLRLHHVAGALLGMAGAALIISGGRLSLDWAYLPGYLSAALAAVIWACYSLLTRRLPPFPGEAVGAFCFAAGLLSLGGVLIQPGWRSALGAWQPGDALAVLLLGAGPLGIAFYAWDAALKRGDPRVIGALAYLTPLLSTLNLVLFAGRSLNPVSALAMALIIAGALLGSLDSLRALKALS